MSELKQMNFLFHLQQSIMENPPESGNYHAYFGTRLLKSFDTKNEASDFAIKMTNIALHILVLNTSTYNKGDPIELCICL